MTDEQKLRDRIAELEEEVRQLRQVLAPDIRFSKLQIGPVKTRILSALAQRVDQWTRSNILFAAADPESGGQDNLIRQHIFQLRRALKPHNVEIQSATWHGYRLDTQNAERLKALM